MLKEACCVYASGIMFYLLCYKQRNMKKGKHNKMTMIFERFAAHVTRITGSALAFIIAITIIVVWAVSGPLFHFSDTWQLVINTGTTIITFLMVFVIQHAQNKDTVALHLKLNELIASQHTASNRLISVEDLTEEELEVLKEFYIKLATLSKKEKDIFATHSIDEAQNIHSSKMKRYSDKSRPDNVQ